MNRRNLVPIDRRRRRALRRAATRWAMVVPTLATTLLATAAALMTIVPASRAEGVAADRAAAQANAARAAAAAVRVQVAIARQSLAAAREVADQPDWSLLLADLSRRLGDDGVLGNCQLSAGDDPTAFTLRLGGVARSEPAVTMLALRLERAGLFDRVDLLQTTPAKVSGGEAVAFQILCTIGPATASTGGRAP